MEISNPILAAFGIQELWPILLIVVVLFGAKKIPELARGLGSGMKEFKKAVREVNEEDEPAATKPSPPSGGAS
jgi:sec-independent protein translocase protein TatA